MTLWLTILWLIVFSPLVFLAARWAWRYQHRVLFVTGTGLAHLAGRPGLVADVQLTSVLVDEPSVLIGFRPAGTTVRPRAERWLSPSAGPEAPQLRNLMRLVVSLDNDVPATIARLRRWEASSVALVMWRDPDGKSVEMFHLRTGQRAVLSVIPEPVDLNAGHSVAGHPTSRPGPSPARPATSH